VLPDGRVDLIWASDGKVLVIGPQTRALVRPLAPHVVVVGLRFLPGVGPPLLGVPAHELADMHVSLEAIDARPAAALVRDLVGLEHHGDAPARIARAVARRMDSYRYRCPDTVVRRAATLLRRSDARVERVANALSISERQLQRRFREAVGYGPKTLHRVLRFQRLLQALSNGSRQAGGVASIATAIGYSDQAHLTREVRALSGLSPLRLERTLGILRDEGASGVFKTGGQLRDASPESILGSNPRAGRASTSNRPCRLHTAQPMAEDKVQIVERAFDAICRRDIDGLLELYDPDIEFLPLTGTLVESGGYAGHAGVRDYFEEVAQVWEEMRPYAHTTQPVGDHVVVTGGCAVRGMGSGVESDDRMAWVITVQNGKIVRHRGYARAEEALEAVGLY
jgi:ketosteroid isomerase-like protein/AraC-like DNA-binding protein